MSNLALPVLLRVLGDEVRALKEYVNLGILTQDEADERIADWQLFYPPGWYDIETLVSARRFEDLSRQPEFSEAAE